MPPGCPEASYPPCFASAAGLLASDLPLRVALHRFAAINATACLSGICRRQPRRAGPLSLPLPASSLALGLVLGLLSVPAAPAAPGPAAATGSAAVLGGVLRVQPEASRPIPASSVTPQAFRAAEPFAAAAAPAPSPRRPDRGQGPAESQAEPVSRPRPTAAPPSSAGTAAGTPKSAEAVDSPVLIPDASVRRANSTPLRPSAPPGAGGGAAAATPAENGRELVLDRRRRQLLVLQNGTPLRRFPVAVGMPGWETPVGRFNVLEKQANPVWEHPVSGLRIQPGPDNPLGSRWIGFYRDCRGRRGFNGKEHLVVKGCVVAGFHGTPHRGSIGRAVSHGCVRLYDEHVRDLFELVAVGTPVTVLP